MSDSKSKTLPFTTEQVERIISQYQTPFHIYDEKIIRENVRDLYKAFSWMDGFKNYFTVKAPPNRNIMKLLHGEGLEMDCSSIRSKSRKICQLQWNLAQYERRTNIKAI